MLALKSELKAAHRATGAARLNEPLRGARGASLLKLNLFG